MSKIPSRQTLAGIGGNPLYVPMDGDGNASVSGNLEVGGTISVSKIVPAGNLLIEGSETITQDLGVQGNQLIAKSLVINENLFVDGTATIGPANIQSLVVHGSQSIGAELTVGNGIVAGSLLTAGGSIICSAPGIFVGDGSGLTNLPQATLGPPNFYFQSQLIDFSVVVPNRYDPAINVPTPAVTIPCEMFGKPTGLYFWKTDTNIALPQLFNSASGMLYWDGTKISGQTTYSLTQLLSAFNPLYSLTMTYLSFTSLTVMDVVIESTNSSINPAQFDAYFVNFYKIF